MSGNDVIQEKVDRVLDKWQRLAGPFMLSAGSLGAACAIVIAPEKDEVRDLIDKADAAIKSVAGSSTEAESLFGNWLAALDSAMDRMTTAVPGSFFAPVYFSVPLINAAEKRILTVRDVERFIEVITNEADEIGREKIMLFVDVASRFALARTEPMPDNPRVRQIATVESLTTGERLNYAS